MKVVTWNCEGAFRKKVAAIEALKPDIAVIAECEAPEKLRVAGPDWLHRSICWHGEDPAKESVAVIVFDDRKEGQLASVALNEKRATS